jgi:hypothetical protein
MLLTAFSSTAAVADCSTPKARINDLYQYPDGAIFVVFDQASDCACGNWRMAFHRDDANAKFMMSQVLTSVAAGKQVRAVSYGVDTNCPIHGNTPRISELHIYPD